MVWEKEETEDDESLEEELGAITDCRTKIFQRFRGEKRSRGLARGKYSVGRGRGRNGSRGLKKYKGKSVGRGRDRGRKYGRGGKGIGQRKYRGEGKRRGRRKERGREKSQDRWKKYRRRGLKKAV